MDDPRADLAAPEATYQRRLRDRSDARKRWTRQGNLIGAFRLLVFSGAVLSMYLAWRAQGGWPWGILLPLGVVFAVLMVIHERIVRRRDAAGRAAEFYRDGLKRIRGDPRPASAAVAGPEGHAYAGDLDLFGSGSMFERIDTTRTPHGQRFLAARLASAAPQPPTATEIRRRQEAVRELVPLIDLRESLAEAGHGAGESQADAQAIAAWAALPPAFTRPGALRLLASGFPAVLMGLIVASLLGAPPWLPWAWATMTMFAYVATAGKAHAVTRHIGTPARVLGSYQRLADVIEGVRLQAASLADQQRRLSGEDVRASREIHRLRRISVWTEALRNQIVMAIGLFTLWELHCALSLEAWRRRSGAHLEEWLSAVGEVETAVSLAAYAYEHPDDTFPQIVENGEMRLRAEGLGHPLLDPARRVRNPLSLDEPGAALLVSGSNMSGKSTMLRSVGANAVLALSGTVVCATRMEIAPMAVVTSMRVVDSLQEGTSHFLAELYRLKRVTDLCDAGVPLLYLLDEVLHGTNSRERILGVHDLVAHLIAGGAMGMITTHDLDLADLEDRHPGKVRNVHFSDDVDAGLLHFDYRMHDGVARTTNALRLMREVGIPLRGD